MKEQMTLPKYGGAYMGNGIYTSANKEAYKAWWNMLYRCYNPKSLLREPTYIGCTVCSEWLNFQNFAEWFYAQKKEKDWALDKDIICKGNKVYSPETCGFVPQVINSMIIRKRRSKELPTGVHYKPRYNKQREITHYVIFASCKNGQGKQVHLGYFNSPEAAFIAYKCFKESVLRKAAKLYQNRLDDKMYNALINYQI